MSATYLAVAVGEIAPGPFLRPPIPPHVPRWIWGGAGAMLVLASVAGWAIARRLGGEQPAEAESRASPAAVAAN
jgi:hypothetical protein